MYRSATRLLASAAVIPVMFVAVAGCSGDSGEKAADEPSASKKTSAAPSPAPAKYSQLPKACDALGKGTVKDLVPGTDDASGSTGKSSDVNARGTCSWHGLDGFQYRWLDISLQRFESNATLGSAESRAKEHFADQVKAAKNAEGGKAVKTGAPSGIGDEAATVRYDLTKDGDGFKNQTVVARVENVVITLNYNGAGYEKAGSPKAADLLKDAEKAAEEAAAAVTEANK